jgi:isoamylase
VVDLRRRQQRNLLTTLLLSEGVPMLLGGDELGRTQQGNNNAWCQDSAISWYDWDDIDDDLFAFTRQLIALRHSEPVFRRRDFLVGGETTGRSQLPDVVWFGCDGDRLQPEDWDHGDSHALGVFLNGEEIPAHDREGQPVEGRSMVLLFNAFWEPLSFTIPRELGDTWCPVLGSDQAANHPERLAAGDQVDLRDRSVLILRRA